MADTIGIKIGIDGEKEFKAAITAINSQMKAFSSEMYASVDSMMKVSDKQTLITNKTDILKKQIETTKQKIEVLSGEYDRQVDYLSELDAALQKTTVEFGENSDEALKAQNAYNKQVATIEKLQTQLNTAQGDLNSYSYEMDHVKDSMKNAGKEGSLLGNIIKGEVISEAIISGVKKLASAFMGFAKKGVELASDLQEVQNVVDVTFGDGAKEIDTFAKSAATSFGLSELQAKQFTGTLGAMFSSMGLGEDDVKNMSVSLTGLAADIGSFYNLDAEDAFAKLRAGISGETEPLKQLGINMSQANLEAFALSQGIGKTYSSMTEAEKATLRYNYIMAATSNAQGDFARTSDSFANQQKILELNMSNLASTIGTAVLPVMTNLTTWLNDFLSGTSSFNIDTLISGLQAAIPVMAGLTAAFVAYKVALGITAIIDAFRKAQEAGTLATQLATFAQKLLNAELLANPIVLVITLIAGLVAALATAYATSETFREKVNAAFGAVKKVVEGVVNFFIEGWNNVKNAWGQVSGFFTDVKNKISGAFSNIINSALTWGKDLLQNFTNGIKSKIQSLVDTVKNVGRKVKDFLGFSEPDKGPLSNFHTFAPDMMKLYAQGIKGNTWRVEDAAEDAAASISGAMGNAIGGALSGGPVSFAASGTISNLKTPSDAVTNGSLYRATEAAVNGMSVNAGSAGADNGDMISININMDGRTLASVLFDPLKKEVMQRGVGLA